MNKLSPIFEEVLLAMDVDINRALTSVTKTGVVGSENQCALDVSKLRLLALMAGQNERIIELLGQVVARKAKTDTETVEIEG